MSEVGAVQLGCVLIKLEKKKAESEASPSHPTPSTGPSTRTPVGPGGGPESCFLWLVACSQLTPGVPEDTGPMS